MSSRALIVGGGLIGLLSARALRARGFDVVVVDAGAVGRAASWAGGGILSPLYPWRFPDAVTALAQRSLAAWPELAATLAARTGIDPEYRAGGMLVLDGADDPAEVDAWAALHDVRVERLDRAAAARLEPGIAAPADTPAWYLPDVASVRNPRLLRAALATAVGEGVTLREHAPVAGIAVEQGRAVGVDAGGERLGTDVVVVCAGAWSLRLLAGLGATAPGIRPVRGQMIAFDAGGDAPSRIVLSGGHYLIPRADGLVLAGSTLEETGFDAATTNEARAALAAFAVELLPALRDRPVVAHWAGLRPGSDDGVPTIDAHPDVAGLWINAGHFRNGIVTAPASAELLGALVAGDVPPLDPAPYAWPPE